MKLSLIVIGFVCMWVSAQGKPASGPGAGAGAGAGANAGAYAAVGAGYGNVINGYPSEGYESGYEYSTEDDCYSTEEEGAPESDYDYSSTLR